jgi:hypothetical protein
MLVSIRQDIFSNPKNDYELDDLLTFFKKGKHQLILNEPDDFLAFDNSTWKVSLKGDNLKLILRGLKSSRFIKKIIISDDIAFSEEKFSLEEAYLFLDKPLQILVEHNEYDEPFYFAIIKNFDFTNNLLNAFQNGWLEFDHGGGSTIESVVRNSLKRNGKTSPYFVKPLEKYLRYYVIKDSDREFCRIQSDGSIIQQELTTSKTNFFIKNNVPFHYLYKREKENYIPDSVFEYFMHDNVKKQYAESYLKLNNHQKDFLDIEKGFSYYDRNERVKALKDRNELDQNVKELYKKVGDKDYEIIGLGFSDSYSSFKTKFSLEFKNVSKEQMLSRIKHQPLIMSEFDGEERNEFDHIVNEIKRLL